MENIAPNHGDEAGATDAQWRAKFIQESPHLYCFILRMHVFRRRVRDYASDLYPPHI